MEKDTSANYTDVMGTENIGKLLLKFSIPAIISLIITAIYSTVDMAIIGRFYGENATAPVAAISLSYPIYGIVAALSTLIGVGSNTLFAINLGRKNFDITEKILGQTIILLILVGVFFSTIGQILLEPFTLLCGASKETLSYAMKYNRIYLAGSVSVFLGFGLPQLIRGEGNIVFSTITSAFASVMNMIGDYILVYSMGLGISGASISTIISLTIQSIIVVIYYIGGFSLVRLRLSNLKLDTKVIFDICKMGIGPCLIEVADSFVLIIFNLSLVHYGRDLAIGAMGIAKLIFRLAFLPIMGLQQCIQPLIGYNYGAEKYDRVKELTKKSIIIAIIIGTIGILVILIFPRELILIFGENDIKLIEQGTHVLRIISIMLPMVGIQLLLSGYFQSITKTKIATFLNLSRYFVFLIPMVVILPLFFGQEGVYWSVPISDALAILTSILVYKKYNNIK